ncbi:hypothetical protein BJ322DRAFT_1021543 [Thelephora terrestris]|uniref:Uncharacterized protein n=1 Tax=Thelephora terrestris TaxID=56493 RepID=A0A9P6HC23_9AGAM|nr:hypothetical protein BJ322DRAFT_1021543 [Thelephora terrestris]
MPLPPLEMFAIWSEEQSKLEASEKGRIPESGDDKRGRRAPENLAGRQKAEIDAQAFEITMLRGSIERCARKYDMAKERIARLEHEIEEAPRIHRKTLQKRDQHIRAMEDKLAQTKQLLSARTNELSRAQSFLSTTDRLSEAEVLSIVRDLNENVFQVAASLTEEWEKLASSQPKRFAVSQKTVDSFSQYYGPALLRRVLDRYPVAVTFLVQSCLCSLVAQFTLSWRRRSHKKELAILGSIYQNLSASEAQAISARWRSLTHNYLTKPSPHNSTESIMKRVANILSITGSFQSSQHSFDFVKAKAFNRMETIDRLAQRLESVFMMDVASSDMYLIFQTPRTAFDDMRMTKEFESTRSPPQREEKVAGTTEVGVGKSVGGRGVDDLRIEVLLKAKVVLEHDLADS